jgi:hypothetical protein
MFSETEKQVAFVGGVVVHPMCHISEDAPQPGELFSAIAGYALSTHNELAFIGEKQAFGWADALVEHAVQLRNALETVHGVRTSARNKAAIAIAHCVGRKVMKAHEP